MEKREMKFRAWDKKKKQFRNDVVLSNKGVPHIVRSSKGLDKLINDFYSKKGDTLWGNYAEIDYTDWYAIEYVEIYFYIGRKDKVGNEIYEGNICELEVEYDYGYSGNDSFHGIYTGVVRYIPSIGYHLKISKTWDVDNDEKCDSPKFKTIVQYRTKIIGNICENPELIKE